jgi:hypothetical protein
MKRNYKRKKEKINKYEGKRLKDVELNRQNLFFSQY